MTESEQKIYDAVMDFRQDQAGVNATLLAENKQMKELINKHANTLSELEAIRDKGIGALWLGGIISGSGFLAGIGALIYSWTKH